MTAALASGGDPAAQDQEKHNTSALHKAALNKETLVVKLLLEQGVDPDIRADGSECEYTWVETQETVV